MIKTVMQSLGPWGPVFFGIGFLAPLLSTLMINFNVSPPLGLSTIQAGLIIGFIVGLQAKLRGRWL
tara:strand:- start:898 stop:1095 length:198 start_codon:yes stop_codon:yes gene_type:complete